MATNKITKKDKFAMLLKITEVAENPMLVEFINHELELLAKKNSGETKKPTAQQLANQSIQKAILDFLEETGKAYTITELIKEVPECADLTNQKVSALVRQLKETDFIEKIEDKKKSYFKLKV